MDHLGSFIIVYIFTYSIRVIDYLVQFGVHQHDVNSYRCMKAMDNQPRAPFLRSVDVPQEGMQ